MFETILKYFFETTVKLEIDIAEKKILKQQIVRGHSLSPTDLVNGSIFIVGTKRINQNYGSFDHFRVLFGQDQEDVVIKYDGEIVYYFNTKEEVTVIRDAIIECYNNMNTRTKKETASKFARL